MKKLYTLSLSILVSAFAIAQSTLLVTNVTSGNSTITNGMIIYRAVGAGIMDQVDINIKNTSSSTKSYKMRMYYDLRHVVAPSDSSNPYFCFGGTCYPVNKFISTQTETLTPGQDAVANSHPISVHYDEASAAGISSIRYKIYDMNNSASDFMEFTVVYNNNPAALKTNTSLFSNVSDVYPNPSGNKAFVSLNTSVDLNNVSISITNSLGSIVSSKNMELNIGKNVIPLDVESLSSGIYFTTITSGNSKIVKKIIINK